MGTTRARSGSPLRWTWLILLSAGCDRGAEDPPAGELAASPLPPPPPQPIVQWLLSPTYAFDPARKLAEQHFAPEEGLAAFSDVIWLPVTAAVDGAVDLRRFDPVSKRGVVCARAPLVGDRRRTLELEFVSDDALVATLDGATILEQEALDPKAGEGAGTSSRRVRVELTPGDHELLLKIATVDVPWSFRVEVQTLP